MAGAKLAPAEAPPPPFEEGDAPPPQVTPSEAAERGWLDMLKSLHRRGRMTFEEDLSVAAAKGGQFEVLKWLRAHECQWNMMTCA